MSELIITDKKHRLSKANERLGMTKLNKHGEEMAIISYKDALNIVVQFKGRKELIKTKYQHFIDGDIKSHSFPMVYKHGILDAKRISKSDNKQLSDYVCWYKMMERCYSEKVKLRHPTYRDVACCDDWLYYSAFKKFYDENYYEIKGQRMNLDKDIIIKGNKIYSPETCVFVPNNINVLFTKSDKKRGDCPIGVSHHKLTNKYRAYCNDGTKNQLNFGLFNTKIEAFNVYKENKEGIIKKIANKYKKRIPKNLYSAMCLYVVKITD